MRSLVRWLAPILSFTAGGNLALLARSARGVGLSSSWAALPAATQRRPRIDWDKVFVVARRGIARTGELRVGGAIGGPLDAEVDVYCSPALSDVAHSFGDELRRIYYFSGAKLHAADTHE